MAKPRGFTVGSLLGIRQGRPEARPKGVAPAAVIEPGQPAVATRAKPCCRSMCAGCPWAEAQRRGA